MLAPASRLMRYFDWVSLALVAAIGAVGVLFVFSATHTAEHHISFSFKKQLFGFAIGIVVYLACTVLDYRALTRYGYFAYLGLLLLLAFTLLKGSTGMGAQRWVSFFFFRVQPSELAKVLFPSFVSHYLLTHRSNVHQLRDYLPLLIALGVGVLLVLKQPDLGTALILLFSGAITLWVAGVPRRVFYGAALVAAVMAPVLWHGVLKQYQRDRVKVFLGYGQAHRERYQTEQSIIAVGSGGICGKGLLRGTQNKFKFLPESRTDFIFAVLGEEWGFVGALAILALYLLLFLRSFGIVRSSSPLCVQVLALGLLVHVLLSALVNIGMVVGLLPVVGVPLPLMSCGTSNLWVTMGSLGLLQGIGVQQRSCGSSILG